MPYRPAKAETIGDGTNPVEWQPSELNPWVIPGPGTEQEKDEIFVQTGTLGQPGSRLERKLWRNGMWHILYFIEY